MLLNFLWGKKIIMKSHLILFSLFFISLCWPCFTLSTEALEPLAPLPLTTTAHQNVAKIILGEHLFSDHRLSNQGKRSCATCHPLDNGGMDGLVRAEATDGVSILRNTPTLFNVGFNYFYNWDGNVTTLEAHTEKVMLNPKIMHASWPTLLATLGADPAYQRDFGLAYPNGLTQANIIDAITSFERSLVTPNARFDRFLRGEQDSLTAEELQGYHLFNSLGCVACHQGINIGGNLFQKFGIFGIPEGASQAPDYGRYTETHQDRDRGVYRVPSLRNVAVTAPYFHDGRAPTLEAAVDVMAKHQLGRSLTVKDRALIVKFLQTLTGEYLGKPVVRRAEAVK
jgi:cytochrome c peroxidase